MSGDLRGGVVFVGDTDFRPCAEMSSAAGYRQEGLNDVSEESFFCDLIGIFDEVRFRTGRRRSFVGLPASSRSDADA
jgi:hypothetical protein